MIRSGLQNLRARFAGTRRVGEIGSAIAVVAGMLAYALPDARYLSYDLPFFFRPKADTSDAVIVYIDEDSTTRLNQSFGGVWHRALHVELLEQLRKQGAKVVVFDLLWDTPWVDYPPTDIEQLDQRLARAATEHPEFLLPKIPSAQVDARLAEAIKRHGKVVLAGKLSIVKAPSAQVEVYGGPKLPCDPLRNNGFLGYSVAPFAPAVRRAIREHFYHSQYPTMGQVAAGLAQNKTEPIAGRRGQWFNFYGPPGTIQSRSYYQVLQRDGVQSNFFAGKIVLVGFARITTPQGENKDDFPTPYFSNTMQGVEIQATACLNYLRGDWLTELSRRNQLLLFVGTGTLFGFLLSIVRPWIALLAAILGFIGVAFAGVQTMWQTGTWFSWLIIGVVQIPAALTWAVLMNTRQLYRENVALEKALKTATATTPGTKRAEAETVMASARDRTVVVRPTAGALPRGSQWQAQPDDIIADHQLVRCVGEGAYGQVWLARNVIGTYTAIKLVYRSKFSDDAPFEREFQGLKRFMPISRGHPGVVQILHVGKTDSYFYYVMEAGDDETSLQNIHPENYTARNLSGDLQKHGPLPLAECLKLAIDLSAALDYLHQRQLIHRDIKPSNIIFVHGQPKIADIGLVTVMATTLSEATYIGTPGYIPPEGPGSAAADVYSLGKVIYEASMGRHVGNYPALPTTLIERPDYKGLLELNEIIIKACAENASVRYRSAAALHADLLRLQTKLAKQAS